METPDHLRTFAAIAFGTGAVQPRMTLRFDEAEVVGEKERIGSDVSHPPNRNEKLPIIGVLCAANARRS
jgi:hypothetical protein